MTISNQGRNVFYSSNVSPDDTKTLTKIYAENPCYQDVASSYEGSRDLNDKLHVYVGDVTDLAVDAIVCSTQTDLSLEPIGICRRVWSVGGEELRNSCISIGHCDAGKAFLTHGYELSAKFVIHTAGPPPDTPLSYAERKQCLRQSYFSCLELVHETPEIKSVAFPCLGTGGAGIQLSAAIGIAVRSLREWLTTGNNRYKVDHIVLCMYDEYQWSSYCPLLIQTFPFPKGTPTGFGTASATANHENASRMCSSNILCYKYVRSNDVRDTIAANFDRLVEMLKQTLACPRTQVSTDREVVIIDLKKMCHHLHVYHSKERGTLEFQIANSTHGADSVDIVTCSEVQAVIERSLAANFENTTTFGVNVRCDHSYMGERRGLWRMDTLQNLSGNDKKVLTCSHPRKKLNHTVDTDEMLKYWRFSKLVAHDGHDKHGGFCKMSSREPEESSMPRTPVLIGEREIEQDSWESLREDSSENTGESETGIKAFAQQNEERINDLSNKRTSNLPSFLKKGVEKLRLFVSPTSSQNATDIQESAIRGPTENESANRQAREYDLKHSELFSSACYESDSSHDFPPRNISSTQRRGVKKTESDRKESKSSVTKLTDMNISTRPGVENDERDISTSSEIETDISHRKNDMSDKILLSIARHIGNKHKELGIELGLRECEVQSCQQKGEGNANMYGFYILKKWRSKAGLGAKIEEIFEAMDSCDIDTYYLRKSYGNHNHDN